MMCRGWRTALGAAKGNFIGPLVTVVTMVRLEVSAHRVLLAIQPNLFSNHACHTDPRAEPIAVPVSPTCIIAPAPTRSLYVSTKAASLTLYQSIFVEHPDSAFTMIIPTTVESDLLR